MIATWVFWTVVFVQIFLNVIITTFTGWFINMRSTGKWGGGREVIDFSAYPEGGVSKWRIFKKGVLFIHSAGGDQGIVLRTHGFMKKEAMKVRISDIIPVGDLFFHGRKGIEKALDYHMANKDQIITQLSNRLSQVNSELAKKDHEIDKIQDKNTKILADTAKAVFGGMKPGSSGKKKK